MADESSPQQASQPRGRKGPGGQRAINVEARVTDDPKPPKAPQQRSATRPVRTIRMSRIRAAIWANNTESGILYNTTFERIYKPDGEEQWKSSESFGPNDLLLLAKVADLAHTWIMRQRGMDEPY